MSETVRARLEWIDALRLVAGLSMVGLHATADASGQPFVTALPEERIIPMMLRAVLYIARTELFLIISIFLLLMAQHRSGRGYAATIALQALRLLLPFLFWTVFYAVFNLIKAGHFGYLDAVLAELGTPVKWVGFLLLGDVKYHMHFIPTLFALVLLFPLYRAAYRWPVLGALILICLMFKRQADLFVYAQFWGDDALPYLVRAIKIASYTGYGMVAAACLALWQRDAPRLIAPWYFALGAVAIVLLQAKWNATWQTIETGRWPYDHTAGYWADFLMPVLLFALCMCLARQGWAPRIGRYARYSFGIYLCHPIFLDLAEILLAGSTWTPAIIVLTKVAIALPCACLLTLGLARSRHLGWSVGLGPLPWQPTALPQFSSRPS